MAPSVPMIQTAEDVEDEVQMQDAQDFKSWLESMGSRQDLRIKLVRKEPRRYKGVSIEGILETYNEFIDEEDIREAWGGGTYQLQVLKRNAKGQYQFHTARTIKISGPPRVPEYEDGSSNGESNGDSGAAIKAMHGMAKDALARAEREREEARRNNNGMDPVMLEALLSPLKSNIESLSRALEQKDRQILQMISSRNNGEPTFQDKMLDKMVDGESARIEAIRTQHASELRQIKENHQEDIRRERDYYQKQIDMQEKRHERDLDQAKENAKIALESIKNSFEARLESLRAEITRLQSDVQGKSVEVAELRAKKDKSLTDQIGEMMSMKEALTVLGGGDKEDDSPKSMPERIIGQIFDNPEAINNLIGGFRPNAAAPEQVPTPPQAMPRPRPAGPVRRKRRPPGAQGSQAQPQQPQDPNAPQLPKLDPMEVTLAIQFMENAVDNGTDPAAFAASAQSVIPRNILEYIEVVGVDEFLNKAAKLSQNSSLRSQKGRNFSREVARILLEGMPTS